VVDAPEHIVGGADVVTVGLGFTVTITVVFPVQPLVVPVTVYVLVTVGLAVTDVPVVALNPVPGAHV
jgi:hypothetical protein